MLQKSKQYDIHIKTDTQRIKFTKQTQIYISQLIFDKYAQSIQWRKDSLVNKWSWDSCRSMCKNTLLVLPHRTQNGLKMQTQNIVQ